jgi:Spy/CpxP family protein refolding chaperone
VKKGIFLVLALTSFGLGTAMAAGPKEDVFKGKLFPPNVILEHQAELSLSKAQSTAIRAAVVEVQAGVAEHEWDMREAYQALMLELDKAPIDEDRVIAQADVALLAENQVKKKQMSMLVRLKNLLTAEQVSYLESVQQ